MDKTAVILLNMGGPDSPEAVKQFLNNLFNDPDILDIPAFIRKPLAKFISSRRTTIAKDIYRKIGGKSPILTETTKQAKALEESLQNNIHIKHRVFIAMRYWHPFASETVQEVKKFNPDKIILLPLYPQFSNSTTGSSIKDWKNQAEKSGLLTNMNIIHDYSENETFIAAHVKVIKPYYEMAKNYGTPRILFSAHSLPQKAIDKGDPYKNQVELTAAGIARKIDTQNLDWVVCYQSRVGKMKWLKPDIKEEIIRAAGDKVPIVIIPISFVSEHSETLVELDILYSDFAKEKGVHGYFRVPALGTNELFIQALTELISS